MLYYFYVGGKKMFNVFSKFDSEETNKLSIQLSNGRTIPLEELVSDYERFLKQLRIEPGSWFRIDREIINKCKEKIRNECHDDWMLERFEWANEVANQKPDKYPNIIDTYIFNNRDLRTKKELIDMCESVGDGLCDKIICLLECQMRICNGETYEDLVQKVDKLPHRRIIKADLDSENLIWYGGGDEKTMPTLWFEYGVSESELKIGNVGVPYVFRRRDLENEN